MCSDHGGPGSVFGDKNFDEPPWGTFDTNDDVDSVWGFNAVSTTKVSQYCTRYSFLVVFGISVFSIYLMEISTL